jgi:hypothetical protein
MEDPALDQFAEHDVARADRKPRGSRQHVGGRAVPLPKKELREQDLADDVVLVTDRDPVTVMPGPAAGSVDVASFLDLIEVEPVERPGEKLQVLVLDQASRSQCPGSGLVGEQGAAAEQRQPPGDVGLPEPVEDLGVTARQAGKTVGLSQPAVQRDRFPLLLDHDAGVALRLQEMVVPLLGFRTAPPVTGELLLAVLALVVTHQVLGVLDLLPAHAAAERRGNLQRRAIGRPCRFQDLELLGLLGSEFNEAGHSISTFDFPQVW